MARDYQVVRRHKWYIINMVNWVRLEVLAAETGYTVKALRIKIERGVWVQGREWRKAPDGRILVGRREYDKWAESEPQA